MAYNFAKTERKLNHVQARKASLQNSPSNVLTSSSAHILQLQQTIGNRAVSQLFNSRISSSTPNIQRLVDPEKSTFLGEVNEMLKTLTIDPEKVTEVNDKAQDLADRAETKDKAWIELNQFITLKKKEDRVDQAYALCTSKLFQDMAGIEWIYELIDKLEKTSESPRSLSEFIETQTFEKTIESKEKAVVVKHLSGIFGLQESVSSTVEVKESKAEKKAPSLDPIKFNINAALGGVDELEKEEYVNIPKYTDPMLEQLQWIASLRDQDIIGKTMVENEAERRLQLVNEIIADVQKDADAEVYYRTLVSIGFIKRLTNIQLSKMSMGVLCHHSDISVPLLQNLQMLDPTNKKYRLPPAASRIISVPIDDTKLFKMGKAYLKLK